MIMLLLYDSANDTTMLQTKFTFWYILKFTTECITMPQTKQIIFVDNSF